MSWFVSLGFVFNVKYPLFQSFLTFFADIISQPETPDLNINENRSLGFVFNHLNLLAVISQILLLHCHFFPPRKELAFFDVGLPVS